MDKTKIVSIDLKGNLLFYIAPQFDRQFLISSWNSGMRYYCKVGQSWQEENIDTGLMLISEENIVQQDEPISVYLKQLPRELIELAQPYRYRQFSMLQLIAQNPALLDLFEHSPNLFWMMVVEAETRSWASHELVHILQQKRELLIEKLSCQPCKKLVRFINKIVFYKGNESEFHLIKKCLAAPEVTNAFNHWRKIPIQALAVAIRFPYFLHTKILGSEVDQNKTVAAQILKFVKYQQTVDDIARMTRVMHRDLNSRYKENISSEMALNRLHANWIRRFNHNNGFFQYLLPRAEQNEIADHQTIQVSNIEQRAFPLCPLGDLENVIQIKNNFELFAEGVDMHHCIGSYMDSALLAKSYFYKVLSPERATIELRINHSKISVIQFKLAHNKKPAPQSYAALHEAFRDYH